MEERNRDYRDIIAEKLNPFQLIKRQTYRQKNKDKSWEYRKYPDIDPNFICISKDGTLGEIWQVGDLKIGLPSSEGKEIINSDLKDDDSVWKRTPIPDEFLKLERDYKRQMRKIKGQKRNEIRNEYFNEKKSLEKKYSDFINKEFDRRKNGLFSEDTKCLVVFFDL